MKLDTTPGGRTMRPLPGAFAQASDPRRFQVSDTLTDTDIAAMLRGEFERTGYVGTRADDGHADVCVPAQYADTDTTSHADAFAALIRAHEMMHVRVSREAQGTADHSLRGVLEDVTAVAQYDALRGHVNGLDNVIEDVLVNRMLGMLQHDMFAAGVYDLACDAVEASDVAGMLRCNKGPDGKVKTVAARATAACERLLAQGAPPNVVAARVVQSVARLAVDSLACFVAHAPFYGRALSAQSTCSHGIAEYLVYGADSFSLKRGERRIYAEMVERMRACADAFRAIASVVDVGACGWVLPAMLIALWRAHVQACMRGGPPHDAITQGQHGYYGTRGARMGERRNMLNAVYCIAEPLLPYCVGAESTTARDATANDGKGQPRRDGPVESAPLPERVDLPLMQGRRVRAWRSRPASEGDTLGDLSRIVSDGAVFAARRRLQARAGTVLIDMSGSMSLGADDVVALVREAPLGTVYGATCEPSQLVVLARGGRYVDAGVLPKCGGANRADAALADWLVKQPAPRVWVTDGLFQGRHAETSGEYVARVQAVARKWRVRVVPDVKAALALFSRGRVSRRGW